MIPAGWAAAAGAGIGLISGLTADAPQTTSQSQLDPASQAAVNQKNAQNTQAWNSAQNVVAQNPTYPSYPGALVQNFTPDQIAGMNLTDQTLGTGQQQLGAASALYGQGAQSYGQAGGQPFQANSVTSGNFPQNYQSYMSPYINGALNSAAGQMERIGQQNQVANHAQAVRSGAYGGDRQAVQDSMNNYNTQVGIGNMYSQGLQSAVNQAGQQFTADQGQSLTAQQANNSTALAGFNANTGQFNTDQNRMLAAGTGMANLGSQAQTMNTNDINNLQRSGALQQQQGQNSINAQVGQFQQQFQQPYTNQALLNSTNQSITPAVGGGTTTNTGQAPNVFGSVLGGATAGAGIYGMSQGTGTSALSSRSYKEGGVVVDEDHILDGIISLPIEKWRYRSHIEPHQPDHIGTYAEEFKNAFGVGDGKSIPYADALGVLMAGTKALNRRIGALEKR